MKVSSCVSSFSTPLSSSPPSWKCARAISPPSASHAKSQFSLLSFPLILCKNLTAFVSYIPNPIYNYASTSLRPPSAFLVHHAQEVSEDPPISDVALSPEMQTPLPKVDKTGRFCSPRAARELALSTLYAACLQGADPIRLLDKRVNSRMESGYEFEKGMLVEYNHMSFGGPPVTTHTLEEADELLLHDQKESEIEAEVLSAPPKLVYNKLILRFARKILVAVAESWNNHVFVIDKIVPGNWKKEPAARILELSILHLAMSEITVLGTRHQIVINEAVDLSKRFCDGAAPRVINGCLRTFVKEYKGSGEAEEAQISRSSPTP